jgi:hypothetical protein
MKERRSSGEPDSGKSIDSVGNVVWSHGLVIYVFARMTERTKA